MKEKNRAEKEKVLTPAPPFKTPMMQQYWEIKQQYRDSLLLFRLGDFYELFFDDAKIGAEVLGIALTARSRGQDGRIPMCGIPYHALDSYLAKLIQAGYKVAICEQLEKPAPQKKMVRRAVVRVVTPGTFLAAEEKEGPNLLLTFVRRSRQWGWAYLSLTSGEIFFQTQPRRKQENEGGPIPELIRRLKPREIILSPADYQNPELLRLLQSESEASLTPFAPWEEVLSQALPRLRQHYRVANLAAFGLEEKRDYSALQAVAILLAYLEETQKTSLLHLRPPRRQEEKEFLQLDETTLRNLEIFRSRSGEVEGSLWAVLNRTVTALGRRTLRQWLLYPLRNKEKIEQRLAAVDFFRQQPRRSAEIRRHLQRILDLERLLAKTVLKTVNPRDLEGLQVSLRAAKEIGPLLPAAERARWLPAALLRQLEPLVELLEQTLRPNPPLLLNQGGYIADGVSPLLDQYREIMSGSRRWLEDYARRERERTGINSLKVKYNKVFGFFIEVSKANLAQVPPDYQRKQTLVNAERFITPELKEREALALEAEEKARQLEEELFWQLREKVLPFTNLLQEVARKLAALDIYCGLAELARENNYCRPSLTSAGKLEIKEGRHPVLEQVLEQPFVANDLLLDPQGARIWLITGPNMAGKSTFLRQTALITIMAQLGSFVPAQKAIIPLRDRIFTRIGAADDISRGQSTFLLEMLETANILHNATGESLAILDEIGRGTSTFDGLSIAWAVVEYLARRGKNCPLTLFATHYHELTQLGRQRSEIANWQMAVEKEGDEIIFLHRVVPGSAWQSYGIEVAALAGLPASVLRRAREILQRLKHQQKRLLPSRQAVRRQESLFESGFN